MSQIGSARQKGIEAVHRGFLYQHLFAVDCILSARTQSTVLQVIAEAEEDTEVVLAEEHWYLQIKYRTAAAVQLSEASSALDRFGQLRREHQDGVRERTPRFFLVCNRDVASTIPRDSRALDLSVTIVVPGSPPDDGRCPPACASVDDALTRCISLAEQVVHTRLAPSTLVWKLASEVALASAGLRTDGHVFYPRALEALLELLYARSQRFPRLPNVYREFESEPDLSTTPSVRVITGLSGAGKTAWIAHRAQHFSETAIYFDVADNTDGTVAAALVREIAAVLVESTFGDDVKRVLYAGASGLASLRALAALLERLERPVTVVLDNAHRISPLRLREVVEAGQFVKWILLVQPNPGLAELRARLDCEPETLGPLTLKAIGEEFRDNGAAITVLQAERIRVLTAGLPLFVKDAALLCGRRFGGDCEALCGALEQNVQTESLGQDVVLRATLAHLSPEAAHAAALLELSDVRLAEPEGLRLISDVLELQASQAAALIRELTDWGIAQVFEDRAVSLHDAFRQVLRPELLLPRQGTDKALRILAGLFRASISPSTPERFIAYCRIAPKIGETSVVVDLAGSMPEHLHEHGTASALYEIVEAAAGDASLSNEDRFWATDTLTFWDLQRGASDERIALDVQKLEERFTRLDYNRRALQTVAIKRLLVAGRSGSVAEVRRAYGAAISGFSDSHGWLILRYSYGVALLQCGEVTAADLVTRSVVKGYLDLVGLTPRELFMANAPAIRDRLGARAADVEVLKHVADAIDLRARVVAATGRPIALLKVWAFKLYALANAPVSAVKTGKDVVDELLSIGELGEALKFMERTLLPGIIEYGLAEEVPPLHAQHAVLLAYAGRIADARQILAELSVFASTSDFLAKELANQSALIDRIESGEVALHVTRERNLDESGMLMDTSRLSAGRNDPCVCRSGLKFKRCCGR